MCAFPDPGLESRRGFTLVELLVVIAIIGILISMILPQLGNALVRARAVACQYNLRQQGQALFGYSMDDRAGLMPYGHNGQPGGNSRSWIDTLQLWLDSRSEDVQSKGPIFYCPAATGPAARQPAFTCHKYLLPLIEDDGRVLTGSFGGYTIRRVSPMDIRRPAETMLTADATQLNNFAADAQFYNVPYSGNQGVADNPIPTQPYLRAMLDYRRHKTDGKPSANLLFGDGHVQAFIEGTVLNRHVAFSY